MPASAIEYLSDKVDVAPSAEALATARDRLNEKNLFRELGIPTVPFATVDSFEDLQQAVKDIGLPAILKTAAFGYDGKGQSRVESADALAAAWDAMGRQPAILEAFIDFEMEISVVAARGIDGSFASYGVLENIHRNHILDLSIAPGRVPRRSDGCPPGPRRFHTDSWFPHPRI